MSSTSVYSIRIDTRVRKMIEEMPDQNWHVEIRTLIEQSVRKKRKECILSKKGGKRINPGTNIL